MRLRRSSSQASAPEPSGMLACAFCGLGIAVAGRDPLALNIVEGFQGGCELAQLASSTIYAHHACLLDRVDPEVRQVMEED